MTESKLQDLYQAGIAARPRESCVDEERILALVERRGSEDQRLATLDHVMACDACREEFELLRAIVESHESVFARRRRVRMPTMRQWLPIAAALALVVGAVSLWQVRERRAPSVLRGAVDSLAVVEPLGGAAIGPQRFVWRAVEGAVAYDLEVLQSDGTVLATAETRDTVIVLREPWTETPTTYRWWVTARLLDGSTLRSAVIPVALER
jgi:hypothetical protein